MMRAMLRRNIRLLTDGWRAGINFSGGTDSTCLLLAAMDEGLCPPMFTYAVEGMESEDLRRAKIMAARYSLPLSVVYLPVDVETIVRDVRHMKAMGISGKVALQCCHGHYLLAQSVPPGMMLLNGSGIDGIYGTYKQFQLLRKQFAAPGGKVLFDKMRQKHLDNPNDDAMVYQTMLYQTRGVRVVYPYRQQNILDYLLTLNFDEINKPHLKAVTLADFPELREDKGYFRPRGAQQIVAGTRSAHDALLASRYNTGNWKNVNAIYERL